MWKTLLNSTFYFPFKTLTEYKLEFVSELLKLEEALTYHPHDLDLIRSKVGKVADNVLLVLIRSGHPDPYTEDPLRHEWAVHPEQLRASIMQETRRLIDLMQEPVPTDSRVDQLVNLATVAASLIESLIAVSQVKTFSDLYQIHLESKKFGKELDKQRADIIKIQPYLEHDLHINSVYPLHFKPSEHLCTFMSSHQVEIDPDSYYTMQELLSLTHNVTEHMSNIMRLTQVEIQSKLAHSLGCMPGDIYTKHSITLINPLLKNVTCPSFSSLYNLRYPGKGSHINPEAEKLSHITELTPARTQLVPVRVLYTPVSRIGLVRVSNSTPVITTAGNLRQPSGHYQARKQLSYGIQAIGQPNPGPWYYPIPLTPLSTFNRSTTAPCNNSSNSSAPKQTQQENINNK